MLVHIRENQNSWQTITVQSEKQAISKIKEQYANAIVGSWETDWDGLSPRGKFKLVYANRKARDGKSRPIARIRK